MNKLDEARHKFEAAIRKLQRAEEICETADIEAAKAHRELEEEEAKWRVHDEDSR